MAERLTIMTVHAHPDDEVFATGGTLAKYAEQGIHTVNVCCTGGEEGEIVDPGMDQDAVRPRLAAVRKLELEAALRVLGIETLDMLGYRDSGMAGTESNQNPASFHMADPAEAAGRLVRLIRKYRPQVLVSYDENGTYGHPDHIKAYEITHLAYDAAGDAARYPESGAPWRPQKLYMCGRSQAAFERWRQMVQELDLDVPWLRNPQAEDGPRGIATERITTRVDVVDYAERKVEALRCHRTQISPDFFLMKMPPEIVRRAFDDEEYVRVRSSVQAPIPEDDLFAGLR
jgi:mycothiol conjugate amidase Mca